MPNSSMKHGRVVHKSTAGIFKVIPEAVDLVDNPPQGLTSNTVARRHPVQLSPRAYSIPALASARRIRSVWGFRRDCAPGARFRFRVRSTVRRMRFVRRRRLGEVI